MGGDSRRNIAVEVLVDGRSRVGGQQGDALLDGTARRRWRSAATGYAPDSMTTSAPARTRACATMGWPD
jgi:hypothetical protein